MAKYNVVTSTRDGMEKFLDTINKLFGNKKVLINNCLMIGGWRDFGYEEYVPGVFVIEKEITTSVVDDIIDTTGTIKKYRDGDIIQVDKESSDTTWVQVGAVKTITNYSLCWYSNTGSKVRFIGVWDSMDDMALVNKDDEYIITYVDDYTESRVKFKLVTEEK